MRFPVSKIGGVARDDVAVELFALDKNFVRGEALEINHLSLDSEQVIFRAAGMSTQPGRAYEVRISLKEKRSQRELLRYVVAFADLAPHVASLSASEE